MRWNFFFVPLFIASSFLSFSLTFVLITVQHNATHGSSLLRIFYQKSHLFYKISRSIASRRSRHYSIYEWKHKLIRFERAEERESGENYMWIVRLKSLWTMLINQWQPLEKFETFFLLFLNTNLFTMFRGYWQTISLKISSGQALCEGGLSEWMQQKLNISLCVDERKWKFCETNICKDLNCKQGFEWN